MSVATLVEEESNPDLSQALSPIVIWARAPLAVQ